jgi:hypothetical protein
MELCNVACHLLDGNDAVAGRTVPRTKWLDPSPDYASGIRIFAAAVAQVPRFTQQLVVQTNCTVHQPSATATMTGNIASVTYRTYKQLNDNDRDSVNCSGLLLPPSKKGLLPLKICQCSA